MSNNEKINTEIENKYKDKLTRNISFSELYLILKRFQIIQEKKPVLYTIEEFIEQEDYRRDLFK